MLTLFVTFIPELAYFNQFHTQVNKRKVWRKASFAPTKKESDGNITVSICCSNNAVILNLSFTFVLSRLISTDNYHTVDNSA